MWNIKKKKVKVSLTSPRLTQQKKCFNQYYKTDHFALKLQALLTLNRDSVTHQLEPRTVNFTFYRRKTKTSGFVLYFYIRGSLHLCQGVVTNLQRGNSSGSIKKKNASLDARLNPPPDVGGQDGADATPLCCRLNEAHHKTGIKGGDSLATLRHN